MTCSFTLTCSTQELGFNYLHEMFHSMKAAAMKDVSIQPAGSGSILIQLLLSGWSPTQTPGSHMSLSIGGGCVMFHISTRDPSFSCRLGLYVPWVARRFRAATNPTEVRISTRSRRTDARLMDSKRLEVKPSEVS